MTPTITVSASAVDKDHIFIKGHFFKQGEFNLQDIKELKQFEVYATISKRMNTIFHAFVKHYQLELKDGRQMLLQKSPPRKCSTQKRNAL